MIEHGVGNLLQAEVEALVNPVNCDGVMGKGLALQFKRMFPDVFRAYRAACQRSEVNIGRMHVVERATAPRFVINFPTKDTWRKPSAIEYISAGMRDLVAQIVTHNIQSIAIPPLGCGLGGLAWKAVQPIIQRAFAPHANVRVLLFAPIEVAPIRTAHDTAAALQELIELTEELGGYDAEFDAEKR